MYIARKLKELLCKTLLLSAISLLAQRTIKDNLKFCYCVFVVFQGQADACIGLIRSHCYLIEMLEEEEEEEEEEKKKKRKDEEVEEKNKIK